MAQETEPEGSTTEFVAGCLVAGALVALVVVFPRWSLVIVFLVALWFSYVSDTFDRDEDVTTAFSALCWGLFIMVLESLHWFFDQFFSSEKVALVDVLIPIEGLPIDYLYSLFAWGAYFVAFLLFLRAAWDSLTEP